jgi:arginyl-tRNA--protein-N-Asp/Glu arginylyltransferase
MDLYRQMRYVSRDRDAKEQVAKGQRSKQHLKDLMATKIQTTMIGAIKSVEDHLGDLWGHGLHPQDMTDEQYDLYQKWQACRTEILNKGNAQKRTVESEFDQYNITRERGNSERRP